jgi:hypothetical protein
MLLLLDFTRFLHPFAVQFHFDRSEVSRRHEFVRCCIETDDDFGDQIR